MPHTYKTIASPYQPTLTMSNWERESRKCDCNVNFHQQNEILFYALLCAKRSNLNRTNFNNEHSRTFTSKWQQQHCTNFKWNWRWISSILANMMNAIESWRRKSQAERPLKDQNRCHSVAAGEEKKNKIEQNIIIH